MLCLIRLPQRGNLCSVYTDGLLNDRHFRFISMADWLQVKSPGNVTNNNFSLERMFCSAHGKKVIQARNRGEILHRACGRSLNQGMKAPKAR